MKGVHGFRFRLLAVVALWFGLRLAYFNGYYVEDAPGYITDASWAAIGQYHARHYVNGLNVGTYLPVAPWLWLLGKTEVALAVWPMACSLIGLLSVAALCAILFGRSYGLLAAFLYATYPGDIFFSTVVMPDAVQAGWLSLSMLLIVVAAARPCRSAVAYLAGGGVAVGVCHLARANDILLLPVGVLAVVVLSRAHVVQVPRGTETSDAPVRQGAPSEYCERRAPGCSARRRAHRAAARAPWRVVVYRCYLSGWLLVIVSEGAAYWWVAGDFWLRLATVNAHYGSAGSIERAGLNIDASTIPLSAFPPLLWWSRGGWWHFNQDQAYHGFLFCAAVASLAVGLAAGTSTRHRARGKVWAVFSMAAAWLLWPLLYHQFGSQSLTEFVPVHRLSRHIVVYAPGAIVALVCGWAFCNEFVTALPGRSARSLRVVAVGLLAVYTLFSWRAEIVAYNAFHQIKGTYLRIRDHLPAGAGPLVADPGDLAFFDFWLNPLGRTHVRIVPFAAVSACDDIVHGSVVLTRSNPGWLDGAPTIRQSVARLPCLVQPPLHWRLVYDGYPERVFHVE